jgi:oligopeptide transport system substrate-binding protein
MREPKWFNGPYLIREQTKEGIWLERNPYYWDTQQIFFEEIEIKWANHSIDTIYTSFCEGSTDWIGEPISALSPPLLDALEKQGRLLSKKVDRRFLLHFNTRLPALSSPSLRHALSLATDRSYICQSIFPHSIPEIHPPPSDASIETLFKEGLREQGFTKETYPPLNCTYSHQAGREQLALYLQEVWKEKLGISIHLEKNEWNLFRNKLEKGAFDITMTIHEALENSPLEFSDRVEGASSWNFSRWEHPLYRSWIKKARDTEDLIKKQEYLGQAEAILQQEAPFTPLFRCAHLFSHTPQLQNYFFDTEGGIDFSHAYVK